jgi:Molecular chaperone (small heat shock protein)
MANFEKKMPVQTDDEKTSQQPTATSDPWRPLEKLRQQVDHLFEDFNRGSGLMPFRRGLFDVEPFWSREFIENIDIKLSNGNLIIIKGEKKEDKEEKRKGYHVSERHYGAFERAFSLPKGVDADKIEANFSKGVLSISLPKKPEGMKADKKVQIKSS